MPSPQHCKISFLVFRNQLMQKIKITLTLDVWQEHEARGFVLVAKLNGNFSIDNCSTVDYVKKCGR